MSTKTIAAPGRYIQGCQELGRFKKHIGWLGNSYFVIADEYVMSLVRGRLEESFRGSGQVLVFEKFNGECAKSEIDRLGDLLKKAECAVVIGVGGGKTLDTAKAVAHIQRLPVVVVPTIASTDAPCSALSVIYTEEGVYDHNFILPKNPDFVIVDIDIIAQSPPRLLVAGMGDALATYIEARACRRANANNVVRGKATNAAFALAKLCYDILLEDGLKAKIAVENKVSTKALENVVEANIYLSGVGFESCGVAAAHAIYNGMTTLKRDQQYYHGECVAFGTLVQLALENSSMEEIGEVMKFYQAVGLPMTLEDLGLKDLSFQEVMAVAEAVCVEGSIVHNMPFSVDPPDIYASILAADALGKRYKQTQQV